MDFDEYSPLERQERARRIDFAMRHHLTNIYFGEFSKEQLKTTKVKDDIYERLTIQSKLPKFLHAALLVRRNPVQWKNYLECPIRRPHKVFESFFEDKLLVFCLFYFDKMKIFNLDPCYPFLICEQVEANTYIIHVEQDDELGVVRSVIEMWISMGLPWRESKCGERLSSIARTLEEDKKIKEKRKDVNIEWLLWEISLEIGLVDTICDRIADKVYLDMFYFISDASIAVAFDSGGLNTLELTYQLLPQFPEFVPKAIRQYYLSLINPQRPSHQNQPEIVSARQEEDTFPIAEAILNDIFKTKISYNGVNENTPIRNRSVLEVIKKHPELFIRWTTDLRMRKIYRKLIDPLTLYD